MTIRIIAGELRGRRLASPSGRGTRPTRAAVREAWFNAIAGELPEAAVLDLFAGTGALGIEALSRGAASACFIESDARTYRVLRANLRTLGLTERASTRRADAFRALAEVAEGAFDVALADPPYASGIASRLVGVWLERPFSGILCVEHGRGELAEFDPSWHRVYGDTELSFFIAGEEKT